jgi:hypothetical protein
MYSMKRTICQGLPDTRLRLSLELLMLLMAVMEPLLLPPSPDM